MTTRAPPAVETGHYPDEARYTTMCANHSCSPVDISMAGDSMKLIWWYIAAVDEGVEAQGGEDQFHAYWISFEDSVNRLTFEADRDILRKAIEIVEGTSSPSACSSFSPITVEHFSTHSPTATIAVKNGHDDKDAAREVLKTCLSQLGYNVAGEDVRSLLMQHKDPSEALEIDLARKTAPVDDRYKKYQTLLHKELRRQVGAGVYQYALVEEGVESHKQVQDRIRAAIASHALPKIFMPLLSSVRRIYAIGGLSECGKSTIASHISAVHGEQGRRLKIGYFLDLSSRRLGQSVYSRSERDQALAFCNELHAYAQAHYWLKYMTLESVHRSEWMRWVKRILGNTLNVIYVDVDLETRKLRSLDDLATLEAKDRTKIQRGADRVKDIADYVLDNNVSSKQSRQTLQRYLRATERNTL